MASTNKKKQDTPKLTPSNKGPTKSSAGQKDKETIENLQKEIIGLKVQNELLNNKFDFKKVQEELKISDESLAALLTEQNSKLNEKLQEFESVSKNKINGDHETRQRSETAKADAMQTLHKKLQEAQSKLSKFDEMEKQLKTFESETQRLKEQIEEANGKIKQYEEESTAAENKVEDAELKKAEDPELKKKEMQLNTDRDERTNREETAKKNEDVLKKNEETLMNKVDEQKKKENALNSRENELNKREADIIKKEKEVEGRETQLKTNEEDIKMKIEKSKTLSLAETKLQEKEKSMGHTKDTIDAHTKAELDQDLKKKEIQLNNKEDELNNREETVKQKEDVLKKGEEALNNKGDEQKKKEDALNSKEKELKKREADVITKEKEVKERKLQEKEKNMGNKNNTNDTPTKSEFQNLEILLKDRESEIEKLNKQLSGKEREVADLQAKSKQEKAREINNTSTSAKSFKRELEMANIEIEELKTRLSKVVGAQITDGNPDIADLSDLNRPTKLAEKYAELYDNEWTDAYEEIEKNGMKEVEVIQRLLETLKNVYKFCQDVSKDYEKGIKTSALVIPGSDKERPKTPNLPATSRKQIVELRKTFAPTLTEDVFKQYLKSLKQSLDKSPKTKQFVKICIEICWLMSIQDPPVVLDTGNPKGPFDGDKYRTYTRSGKTFDYIVWPPLRLHEAGALLGKGVAQAK